MYRKKPFQPPPLLTERNLDRLGFFSIQTRLPLEPVWESQFQVGGRTVHVHGEGTRGRPHGADTDIMLGIEQLFIAQGSPEDNWLHTTPNALREAAMMVKNGRAFHRIREGLLRVWATGFIVREGWVDPTGRPIRFNAAFRLFEELRYWDKETNDLPELLPDARLSVRLSHQLASSIRAGYTHALRREVLTHLEQPHSRALYRLTEAHRYADDGTIVRTLHVPLMDWREACGIREERASKVMRALDAAHEELAAAGYLADLHVSGRGQHQHLEYVFRQENDPDPALVRLLREYRVGAPRAVQLSTEFPGRVEEAVAYYESLRRQGKVVRNPPGLIADIITHPEKYELPGHLATPPGDHDQDAQPAGALHSEVRAQEEHEARLTAQLALPPERQWKETGATLLLLLKKALGAEEKAALEARCRSGDLLAARLAHDAARAAATLRLQDFVDDLKGKLGTRP
ncbi:replication initiator protein A [Deinococcus aetherius]|nr:replication initiator protein A [Deinococcus aetherius]